MKKTLTALVCLSLLFALLSGCGAAKSGEESGGLMVMTTGYAPCDLARAILGERGAAEMLLPPGGEVHTFEPTPADIISIQKSDLFIYVGGESDEWARDILADLGGVNAMTLMDCVELYEEETVEGMESEAEHDHAEHGDAEYDEHVWTSPRNAALICEKICEELTALDPAGAEYYKANLAAYKAELDELDAAFREVVAGGVRNTLVFADRFPLRYFTEAYGLDYYAAFPGCSEDCDASAATVAFIIDKVKEESIPVVFHIELSNEEMADTVCAATGAVKLQWNACHNVTREQYESGVRYIDLQRENVDALREALA